MPQVPRLIVMGSSNTDFVIRGPRLPRPGETVLGGQFSRAAGGKGANQAVAAARAAREPVVFLAALGDDELGRAAHMDLARENLDLSFLQIVRGRASGIALILVDDAGENLISVAEGANADLASDDVDRIPAAVFAQARVFLTGLEVPWKTVVHGLMKARAHGLLTILNPAPVCGGLLREPQPELVDVLTPNEHELAQMTGLPATTAEEVVAAGNALRSRGYRQVLVTRGAQGSVLLRAGDPLFCPAFSVPARDTTAAGDALSGNLAVALSEGSSWEAALRWASAAAALSVTRAGAQPSLPTRAEIETFLQEQSHS